MRCVAGVAAPARICPCGRSMCHWRNRLSSLDSRPSERAAAFSCFRRF